VTAAGGEAVFTVNGDSLPVDGVDSLGALLRRLEIAAERVVVELNGTIYRRGEGLDQPVGAGDVVEIVHFVGGG
jgi:thiamine biosynthesis protein ThiS